MIVCFWVKVLNILFFFLGLSFFFFLYNLSSQLFVFRLQIIFFFHIDSLLSVLQVGHSASGYLALSRSVLQLSRWFHFIAQKQKQDNGLATSFPDSHSPSLSKTPKGNYYRKKVGGKKKQKKQKTIQELKSTPFLRSHAHKKCVSIPWQENSSRCLLLH